MRRILVENARRKQSVKHGGDWRRVDFSPTLSVDATPAIDVLALEEALLELECYDAQAAKIVKLRFFAGLTHQEAATAMNLSRRAADRLWTVARTWLFRRISPDS
jgi:RNA polymerase sigma factor (TIGR02999 family)